MGVRRHYDVAHSTASLRTSLVGKTVTAFSANDILGPMITIGSAIEYVDNSGRHVEVFFDDGLVLHTELTRHGRWDVYSTDELPRRMPSGDVVVETTEWLAVAQKTKLVETYRQPDPLRHPRAGKRGPDVRRRDADLHESASRLFHYSDPDVVIADALMDPRVMVGIGNVLRCEVLWSCGVHPWAPVVELAESTCLDLVMTVAGMARALTGDPTLSGTIAVPDGLAVYGRNGQPCSRCGGVIRLSKHGESARLLFWCPGCQVAFEPAPVIDDSDPIARAMDPHPAAVLYLRDIFHRRSA